MYIFFWLSIVDELSLHAATIVSNKVEEVGYCNDRMLASSSKATSYVCT